MEFTSTNMEPVYSAVQTNVSFNGPTSTKQGHKCCGGCCDVRRATIVVDIISVCFSTIVLFAVLVVLGAGDANQNQPSGQDNPAQPSGIGGHQLPTGFVLAVVLSGILAYGCGIFGAIQYNIWFVATALLWHAVMFVVDLSGGNVLGAIMPALFAYPHIVFIMEVRSGIMSEANYHNEKHSCCCV